MTANDHSSSETDEVAELIKNGDYFEAAKSWYQAVYTRQISDRAFFLIVGVFAFAIGVMGVISILSLLPVKERWPTLIANQHLDTKQLSITPLRKQDASIHPSILNFFITSYIEKRESYRLATLGQSRAFVVAHSDPVTRDAYLAALAATPSNEENERAAVVNEIVTNENVEPPVAQVNYTLYKVVGDHVERSTHLAVMAYYHSPLVVKEVVDKATGEIIIETEEPQFQVVQYEHN